MDAHQRALGETQRPRHGRDVGSRKNSTQPTPARFGPLQIARAGPISAPSSTEPGMGSRAFIFRRFGAIGAKRLAGRAGRTRGPRTMARKPGTRTEFVLFDVFYEDG